MSELGHSSLAIEKETSEVTDVVVGTPKNKQTKNWTHSWLHQSKLRYSKHEHTTIVKNSQI